MAGLPDAKRKSPVTMEQMEPENVAVPSGKWLEFGVARFSGNMKVSFQAARSIG